MAADDERELQALKAFLKLQPSGAKFAICLESNQALISKLQAVYLSDGKELVKKIAPLEVRSILDSYSREIHVDLVRMPDSFQDWYNQTFYKKCSICSNYGILLICLLCGDACCSSSCDGRMHQISPTIRGSLS
jgi:Proteolysis_6 C-terminal